MSTQITPGTAGSRYTPASPPPATVDALLTALLQGAPFLAPQPPAAPDAQHPPAWLRAAAWPMVSSRTRSADAG